MANHTLDLAFGGRPFVADGDASGLDVAFGGAPFFAETTPTSIDCTATTSQAQTAAAAAEVSLDVAAATSQAQTAAAVVVVINPGEVQSATSNAQSVAADAAVSVDASVTTSQAQSAAAAATPESDLAATTSQAQSQSGELVIPWTLVQSAIDLLDNPVSFTNNPLALPSAVTTGNSLVVLVFGQWRSDGTTITVSDNAGNTYTPGTQFVGSGTPTVHVRTWMQAFYCTNVTGHATLTLDVDLTQTGTVQDILSRFHIAAFEVASLGDIEPDVEEFKDTGSASTTITSDAFTTTDDGGVFVAQLNSSVDSIASSTINFEADYTDLTRPARDGLPDETQGAAGYRITTGALTSEQVTFTGSASSTRYLLAVSFKNAASGVTTDSEVDTSSAQSAAAAGEVSWAVAATTSQAQSAQAAAGVSLDATATTSQAQSVTATSDDTLYATSATSSAQSAAAVATPDSPVSVTTSSATSSAAVAGVSIEVSSTTSSASSAAAVAGVSVSVASTSQTAQTAAGALGTAVAGQGSTSSAQRVVAVGLVDSPTTGTTSAVGTAAGQLGSLVPMAGTTSQAQTAAAAGGVGIAIQEVATRSANKALGVMDIEAENSVFTRTFQTVYAEVGVSLDMACTTSQRAGAVVAAAGVSLDLSAATSSAQGVAAITLGQWIVDVTTAQAQAVAAEAQAQTTSAVATSQAQTAAAECGVSLDMTVATASFSYQANGHIEVFAPPLAGGTSNAQTTQAVADVQEAASIASIRHGNITLRPAVGGAADIK